MFQTPHARELGPALQVKNDQEVMMSTSTDTTTTGYSPPPQQHFASYPNPNPNPYPAIGLSAGQIQIPRDQPTTYPDNHILNGSLNGNLQGHLQARPPHAEAGNTSESKTRLRKACDSCSTRKVKCDEEGPPCKACAALEIPCTFNRPSRRRGPPNKHAEAIKRKKVDETYIPPGFSAPASPTYAAQTLALLSQQTVPRHTAESICPFPIVLELVGDYFTYIHPLIPLPHEPSFMEHLRDREDRRNPKFLALLASMIGCLVASFPRKPRLNLKMHNLGHMFPNSMSLVHHCHKVAIESRGVGYLDNDVTVYDAATSYLIGLTGAYTLNWRQCRLYMGECLTITRNIGLHRASDHSRAMHGNLSVLGNRPAIHQEYQGEDLILREMGTRLFWTVFVGFKSMQQLGASFAELYIPPATPTDPYPNFPIEYDDEYIFPNGVTEPPIGHISQLVGFNANVRVYNAYVPLSIMDMAYGINEVFDWETQKRVISTSLDSVKRALEGLPQQLTLQLENQPSSFEPDSNNFPQDSPYGDPSIPWPHSLLHREHTGDKQKLCYEIQKANIYASQLGTRSYIVEKYWHLQAHQRRPKSGHDSTQNSPGVLAGGIEQHIDPATHGYDLTEEQMTMERQSIVKDLLAVLSGINQVNMEPNGGSFINKIRQVASTLLDSPDNRKGRQLSDHAGDYLHKFVEVVMRLERVSPVSKDPGSTQGEGVNADEEEELRAWADLREAQSRFVQAGGFLSEI
ncbi:MAG: hypothetical protein MMC33_002535 [Icmadophila ericetorum]|nr:hypothetical protein [Icmadophila ericetorum]